MSTKYWVMRQESSHEFFVIHFIIISNIPLTHCNRCWKIAAIISFVDMEWIAAMFLWHLAFSVSMTMRSSFDLFSLTLRGWLMDLDRNRNEWDPHQYQYCLCRSYIGILWTIDSPFSLVPLARRLIFKIIMRLQLL